MQKLYSEDKQLSKYFTMTLKQKLFYLLRFERQNKIRIKKEDVKLKSLCTDIQNHYFRIQYNHIMTNSKYFRLPEKWPARCIHYNNP